MSSVILAPGQPGIVIAIADRGVQTVLPLVNVDGGAVSFDQRKSIITRIAASHETSDQFVHSVGGLIHIYSFGDRIGQVMISGICFAVGCDGGTDNEHGGQKMMRYYNQNKLSVRRDPVIILLGNGKDAIRGFLRGISLDTLDHTQRLLQFTLQLAALPERVK